ncbi:MAG: hypothetical protein QOH96_1820 [Blastocatellia bacterium]|jgi:hypothetical protein|nr:hypothetical protein [Blastocatellia bacterium]
MKKRIPGIFLTLILTCFGIGHAQQRQQPLTNQAVIKLVKAGFKEKTVIAIIVSKPAGFDLSPEKLVELKKSGVSEPVILAMLAHEGGASGVQEDLEDQAFFNGMDDPTAAGKGQKNNDNSTDIFGSSSGSKAHVRSRGPDGAAEDDSQTTGSATVRIIRPTPEAGEAPKLEKTQTLTNNSIVELVEAGFSEGTIVRRIEMSPADYDLSPAKLAELRGKRVGDRLIAAMTSAMGGAEGDPKPATRQSPEK